MRYLTVASILALAQSRRKYLALACTSNCHLFAEWDYIEFGAGQSETAGLMITKNGTGFTGDGEA
jgi:hypothetical protein